MVILDTNVLSEPTRPIPSATVTHWLASQPRADLFTTTVSQAELLRGVELLPPGNRRTSLSAAIEKMFGELRGRILHFDEEAAHWYAKIWVERKRLGRPILQLDAVIAAIARSRRATLATRDTSGFEHCGIRVVNPWAS